MEWKEALYTLNDSSIISNEKLTILLKLPHIRDEVFFPDYEKYGYVPVQSDLTDVNVSMEMLQIGINLISFNANRKLTLAYVFRKNSDAENGVITDAIFILDKDKGWDIMIDMDILIQKKTGQIKTFDYNRLSSYPGSLEEKIKACLKQIKYNYDTYAQDIISGENWDSNAWDDGYS